MTTTLLDKDGVFRTIGALNRNDLKFYQFYNMDFSPDETNFQNYMTQFSEGDATQKILNKAYY